MQTLRTTRREVLRAAGVTAGFLVAGSGALPALAGGAFFGFITGMRR